MQGGRSRGMQLCKDIGGGIIKRKLVSFLRHFFRRHSSARRTAGVGVENALRSIRSQRWPILAVLPSYHVYFRYISHDGSVNCLFYFIDLNNSPWMRSVKTNSRRRNKCLQRKILYAYVCPAHEIKSLLHNGESYLWNKFCTSWWIFI